MVQWVVGSTLHGVDPLSYFSFQPVLHDWCNKGCGMCCPVCGIVHIKAVNKNVLSVLLNKIFPSIKTYFIMSIVQCFVFRQIASSGTDWHCSDTWWQEVAY